MAKTDWNPLLRDQFDEPYWRDLQAFVEHERNVGRLVLAVQVPVSLELFRMRIEAGGGDAYVA